MIHLLLALLSLLFHWQSHAAIGSSDASDDPYGQHRILAYVLESGEERLAIEASIKRLSSEIEDRDLLLVNLGDIELETEHSLALGEVEREMWRTLWNLDLSKSQFILIGKDGSPKAFQKDGLDLNLFFDLIDTMPMRLAELRERSLSSRLR